MTPATRVPQRAATRRAAILDAARALFAAEGISAVTTNAIAQSAGVSPGNLYYWFPSKAEIVHALFEQWSDGMRVEAALDHADALRMLWRRVTESVQPDSAYEFFLRDLFPLLHADPVLAEAYRERYLDRRDRLIAVVDDLIRVGLLNSPEPPITVADLVSVLWLIAETARPFADAVADEVIDARRYGRAVLQPLLTDEARMLIGLSGSNATKR